MPSEPVTAKRVRLIVLPGQRVERDGTTHYATSELSVPEDAAAELVREGLAKRKQTGPPRRARRR